MHHHLVSKCLDVWEILFYYLLFQERISIQWWDYEKQCDQLKAGIKGTNGANEKHALLGQSLDLFFRGAGFKDITGIFYLKYGDFTFAGSSPFTGFFTSGTDFSNTIPIPYRPSAYYFTKPRALDERPLAFQRYLHIVNRYAVQGDALSNFMGYVSKFQHQEEVVDIYDPLVYSQAQLQATYNQNYATLSTANDEELVLLDKLPLNIQIPVKYAKFKSNEDFRIKSTLQPNAKELVLKTRPDGRSGRTYIMGQTWNDEQHVPHYVDPQIALTNRELPGISAKHPWLTMGDFLEEYLVKLPYNINDHAFLNGSPGGSEDFSFLLPIKPRYFEYFTVEDLAAQLKIEASEIDKADGDTVLRAVVKLKISTGAGKREDYITFEREYEGNLSPGNNQNLPDLSQIRDPSSSGKGGIIHYPLGLMIFPFMKTSLAAFNNFYRVGLIDGQSAATQLDLRFFAGSQELPRVRASHEVRNDKSSTQSGYSTTYYAVEGIGRDAQSNEEAGFDFIQIGISNDPELEDYQGIIVPYWYPGTPNYYEVGNQEMSVAVDFGTTNTNLAVSFNGQPQTFTIGEPEIQVARLDKIEFKGRDAPGTVTERYDRRHGDVLTGIIAKIQRHEFIPTIIGDTYRFPTRTAVYESPQAARLNKKLLLQTVNVAFPLNRRFLGDSKWQAHTNLKWDRSNDSERRMTIFLRQLMYMLRAKAIAEGVNPKRTRLYWFVPISIDSDTESKLGEIWRSICAEVLECSPPVKLTESVAPYHYLIHEKNQMRGRNVLNIDIGGGTTDILFSNNGIPQYGTSFRFAGNSVFGTLTTEDAGKKNAIVQMYKDEVEKRIKDSGQKEIEKHFEWYFSPSSNTRSEDAINFFFSLDDEIIDFGNELWNDRKLKVIFLLFYTAIQFHCAQLARLKGLGVPSDIAFTGKGSNILRLIEFSPTNLTKVTSDIYHYVVHAAPFKKSTSKANTTAPESPKKIGLHTFSRPKEVTCEGALYGARTGDLSSNEFDHTVYLMENLKGPDQKPIVSKGASYEQVYQAEFPQESSAFFEFLNLFQFLFHKHDFRAMFQLEIRDPDELIHQFKIHAPRFFQAGINHLNKNLNGPIRETVFFYAVLGAIDQGMDWIFASEKGQELTDKPIF